MGKISYSGSYIGEHKSGDGRDLIVTYPPDFVMVFKNYRKTGFWERDAKLDTALTAYVNKVQFAPKVHHGESGKASLENINIGDVPTSITGGKLAPEAEKMVDNLINVSGKGEKPMEVYDKAAGLDKSKISTVKNLPIILVAIAIGVLGYFLFGKQRA